MAQTFQTPTHKRFLNRLQLFLALCGFILLMVGGLRIGVELLGNVGEVAEALSPDLFSTVTLVLGVWWAVVGYSLLYAATAVGAMEPPALRASQIGLGLLPTALFFSLVWALFTNMTYFIALLVIVVLLAWLSFWFWRQLDEREIWKVFGQPIGRFRRPPNAYIVVGVIAIILLVTLGVIYAILTDEIELPPSETAAGELLYATTFEDFNDEWDLPEGRQSAEIIDGELVLSEGTAALDTAFYTRLDSRKFSDFDLQVVTRHVSGDIDNSYGVIFRWRDFDNYYRFEISSDGFYRLSKTEAGSTETITQWIESENIRQGEGAQNLLRITAQNDAFRFFINEQPALLCTKGDNREPLVNPLTGECISNDWEETFTDDSFRQGRIGLLVGTTQGTDITQPVIIGFDNLVLVGTE